MSRLLYSLQWGCNFVLSFSFQARLSDCLLSFHAPLCLAMLGGWIVPSWLSDLSNMVASFEQLLFKSLRRCFGRRSLWWLTTCPLLCIHPSLFGYKIGWSWRRSRFVKLQLLQLALKLFDYGIIPILNQIILEWTIIFQLFLLNTLQPQPLIVANMYEIVEMLLYQMVPLYVVDESKGG